MSAELFDYIDEKGTNIITSWLKQLPKQQLAKVNSKIKSLSQNGDQILPGFVTDAVGSRHIKEIVIGGNIALRLLLCRGPINTQYENAKSGNGSKTAIGTAPEFTFLLGAEERDGRYVPANAVQLAEAFRERVINNSDDRRTDHVHVRVGP